MQNLLKKGFISLKGGGGGVGYWSIVIIFMTLNPDEYIFKIFKKQKKKKNNV